MKKRSVREAERRVVRAAIRWHRVRTYKHQANVRNIPDLWTQMDTDERLYKACAALASARRKRG